MSAKYIISFEKIKSRLCVCYRLAYLDMERLFVLYTDASKIAVGAVFLQRDFDNIKRVVSFFSKKLS